jgi:hypothetical protein
LTENLFLFATTSESLASTTTPYQCIPRRTATATLLLSSSSRCVRLPFTHDQAESATFRSVPTLSDDAASLERHATRHLR